MGGIKTGVSLAISLEILQTTTFNVFFICINLQYRIIFDNNGRLTDS